MKIISAGLWKNVGACIVLIFGAMAMYRLFQAALQPGNIYRLGHMGLVILLVVWAGWLLHKIIRDDCRDRSQGRWVEFKAILGLSLIVGGSFLLIAWGKILAGSEHIGTIPFAQQAGSLLQAGCGILLVLMPIWGGYFLLNRVMPGRVVGIYPSAAMLCCLGLILLYRIGPDIALNRNIPGFALLFWKQYISLVISMAAFVFGIWFFSSTRLDNLTRKRYVYVLLCVLMMSLTALFGTEKFGRKLSIDLGFFNFQTVELVKLLALFFMVSYFRFEGRFLEQGQSPLGIPRGRYLIPYIGMWILVLMPIFLQRDLGPTALLFVLFLVLFYLGTGSSFSVITGFVTMIILGTVCYFVGVPSMVRTRLDMWLDPFNYSQNITESLWAITSGGWFGTGIGQGMAYKIPVVWSDFTYAVIVEEWGVLGGIGVLLIFFGLVISVLRAAMDDERDYCQLLAAGVATLWLLAAVVIVGGNMGLLPLTGITLPFVSYGGSSLIMNWICLALVLRISTNQGKDRTIATGELGPEPFINFFRKKNDRNHDSIYSS